MKKFIGLVAAFFMLTAMTLASNCQAAGRDSSNNHQYAYIVAGISIITVLAAGIAAAIISSNSSDSNTSPPVINSSLAKTVVVNTNFNYQITATNLPTSFNASGLPEGLSIDQKTGVISGTLAVTGTYNIIINATNAGGTSPDAALVLTINHPIPVIDSASTATAIRGEAFTYTITASNIPDSFSASDLPDGLSLDANTGAISGTPTVIGSFNITMNAINAEGTSPDANLALTINQGAPASITPQLGTTPQSRAIRADFTSLTAIVEDDNNNPVSDVSVTFTAPSESTASGTFSNDTNTITVTTDDNGIADPGTFTANSNAGGPYTVIAVVQGVVSNAVFSLTNINPV